MIAKQQVWFAVLLLPVFVSSQGLNARCSTPNGEIATCVSIKSCPIIRNVLRSNNASLIQFARESQCGYDKAPLVCCGTVPYKSARGSSCTTPDGETARCEPLSTCKAITDRIKTNTATGREFAIKSQCGHDSEPLVCCGLRQSASLVSSLFPDRSICGFEKPHDKVYGGEATTIVEHPWMALLHYRFSNDGADAGFKCGGTLINARYVLTAAHCVVIGSSEGIELDYVRLGEWNITSKRDCYEGTVNEECSLPVVDVKIQTDIVHDDYHYKLKTHDIALLRLEENVEYTDYVKPICLLPPGAADPELGSKLTIVGWGQTEKAPFSDIKLKAEIPIVPRSICSQKILRIGAITEDQICAGGYKKIDSCFGDSGGPLMATYEEHNPENKQQQWYQEGIISYGLQCGNEGFPAVYIRISKYINWMIANMKEF